MSRAPLTQRFHDGGGHAGDFDVPNTKGRRKRQSQPSAMYQNPGRVSRRPRRAMQNREMAGYGVRPHAMRQSGPMVELRAIGRHRRVERDQRMGYGGFREPEWLENSDDETQELFSGFPQRTGYSRLKFEPKIDFHNSGWSNSNFVGWQSGVGPGKWFQMGQGPVGVGKQNGLWSSPLLGLANLQKGFPNGNHLNFNSGFTPRYENQRVMQGQKCISIPEINAQSINHQKCQEIPKDTLTVKAKEFGNAVGSKVPTALLLEVSKQPQKLEMVKTKTTPSFTQDKNSLNNEQGFGISQNQSIHNWENFSFSKKKIAKTEIISNEFQSLQGAEWKSGFTTGVNSMKGKLETIESDLKMIKTLLLKKRSFDEYSKDNIPTQTKSNRMIRKFPLFPKVTSLQRCNPFQDSSRAAKQRWSSFSGSFDSEKLFHHHSNLRTLFKKKKNYYNGRRGFSGSSRRVDSLGMREEGQCRHHRAWRNRRHRTKRVKLSMSKVFKEDITLGVRLARSYQSNTRGSDEKKNTSYGMSEENCDKADSESLETGSIQGQRKYNKIGKFGEKKGESMGKSGVRQGSKQKGRFGKGKGQNRKNSHSRGLRNKNTCGSGGKGDRNGEEIRLSKRGEHCFSMRKTIKRYEDPCSCRNGAYSSRVDDQGHKKNNLRMRRICSSNLNWPKSGMGAGENSKKEGLMKSKNIQYEKLLF